MKKLALGLFFVCTSVFLFAQDSDTFSGFKLGIAAHPTFGYLKINGQNTAIKSDGLRAGFSYGLLGDFAFADNYTFSTGLLLTTVNGQSVTTTGATETKTIYKLQYVEIPLKLKLFTNQQNGMRFYGELGLGNGINVGAKNDVKTSDNSIAEIKDKNISSDIAAYRGSIIIGGGAEFTISGKTKASAGLAFNNGFTNIQNVNGITTRNSYLGLNLAVFF